MEINATPSIIPPQLGNTADTSTVDRTPQNPARADKHAESQSGNLAALIAPPLARPEGSDPALWDTLTPAEQEYFAAMESIGTLSYGPASGAAPRVVPLGQRLDVRA